MSIQREKILDDIARMAGGTVSIMSGVTTQIKDEIKSRIDDTIHRLDLVPREDFERLEVALGEALKTQKDLEARLSKLEGKKTKATTKKTAAKKTTAKKTTKPKAKKTTTKKKS